MTTGMSFLEVRFLDMIGSQFTTGSVGQQSLSKAPTTDC
jgi:hypothetical protein